MSYHLDDTICALASAPGGAARGIVRASGQAVLKCLAPCFCSQDGANLAQIQTATAIPGQFTISSGESELSGRAIPCDLFLWPDERSYTREPVIELHTIGSPPLLAAIVDELTRHGARPAEPGEFTLRAFLAGRIDLTQAEAVLGVIDAQNEGQFHTALAQLAGGISHPMATAREQLLSVLALLEAGLDFADEDLDFITPVELDRQLAASRETVHQALEQMKHRSDAADLPRVVLVGPPNAGKSSLFNALVNSGDSLTGDPGERNEALVSKHAGATRDYLTARLVWGEMSCELIDTAGVEGPESISPDSSVVVSAQAMTGRMERRADVRLICVDATERPEDRLRQLSRDDTEAISPDVSSDTLSGRRIIVLTKCDAVGRSSGLAQFAENAIVTSSLTGAGLDRLRQEICERLKTTLHESTAVLGTAARCRESLREASDSLARGRRLAIAGSSEELVAAEIRCALTALGKVVGAIYTDDILDRIFSRFCIGK